MNVTRHAALACAVFVSMAVPAPSSAQDDTSEVPASVTEFRDAFVEAVRSWDVDGWSELFAEDGVMMAPSGRTVEGRRAFRELWARSFEGQTGRNPLDVTVLEARVSGELAVVRADYGPDGADPVGQYVWVLEREGESPWRLAWWIFNRAAS